MSARGSNLPTQTHSLDRLMHGIRACACSVNRGNLRSAPALIFSGPTLPDPSPEVRIFPSCPPPPSPVLYCAPMRTPLICLLPHPLPRDSRLYAIDTFTRIRRPTAHTSPNAVAMSVRIESGQRIVSNIGIKIETLWIIQNRVRYGHDLRSPIGRHEPAHAARVVPSPK